MPNLADSLQCKQFVSKLERAESIADNWLTEWEVKFIADLRDKFETREVSMDLGMTPWSPTVDQINTLSLIASKAESRV